MNENLMQRARDWCEGDDKNFPRASAHVEARQIIADLLIEIRELNAAVERLQSDLARIPQATVDWRPAADVIAADDQHGRSWLALNWGDVVIGTYEWRQGRSPDGWNTDGSGRLSLSDVTHCAPFCAPLHPLASTG